MLADGSAPEALGEGGTDTLPATRTWSNLKDGQNYRSRVEGNDLYLDAIATGGKIGGQFAGCEFHRAGAGPSDWVGMCTELGGGNEALHKLPATLSRFSDERLEGSTADIPVFVMTPVDPALMTPNANGPNATPGTSPVTGTDPSALAPNSTPATGTPATGSATPAPDAAATQPLDTSEPDLSGLNKSDKEAVELTCAADRLSQGVGKYNDCLHKQLDALKATPNPPSLAGLSSAEREDVVLTCSNEKLIHGPGAYNACLFQQLRKKKKLK